MGGSQRFEGAHEADACPRLEVKSLESNPIESLCGDFPSREILTLDTNRRNSYYSASGSPFVQFRILVLRRGPVYTFIREESYRCLLTENVSAGFSL